MTGTRIIRDLLRETEELDRGWQRNAAGRDNPDYTPWMPFPVYDFIALVAEALPALPDSAGDNFLEIGCGPGTRMRLASAIYGLNAHGIDRVPEYVDEARKLGLSAEVADALTWDGYRKADVIWFNRPIRDQELERQLEIRVWEEMAPGAVVICANLEFPPPLSWWPVLDDREVRRWIAQKPGGTWEQDG